LFVPTKDGCYTAVENSEIRQTHQLRLVVYPSIYRVSYLSGGDRRISEASAAYQPMVGGFILMISYIPNKFWLFLGDMN